MMTARGIIGALVLCVTLAAAKEIKVRQEWARTFPETMLSIQPDHLGRLLAVGTDTNSSFALILDGKGRISARVELPFASVAAVNVDEAGRIFLGGNSNRSLTIQCAALAPTSLNLLWTHDMPNVGFAGEPQPNRMAMVNSVLPDEMGGAYVFGGANAFGSILFLPRFTAEGWKWDGYWNTSAAIHEPVASCRAPNGDLYFIGNAQLFRNGWITVLKRNLITGEDSDRLLRFPLNGYAFASKAACDSQSHLIIGGIELEFTIYPSRRVRCFLRKQSPAGDPLWQIPIGPYNGLGSETGTFISALATDGADNLYASGSFGTVKVSPAGEILWERPERLNNLHVDPTGHVLYTQEAVRADGVFEIELTKLNPDGSVRWQTRVHDDTTDHNGATGLMADAAGDVYVAIINEAGTSTIMKLVEHGVGNERR
jgi:hypothetical protein